MIRTFFLQNIMTSRERWPLTFQIQNVTGSSFYPIRHLFKTFQDYHINCWVTGQKWVLSGQNPFEVFLRYRDNKWVNEYSIWLRCDSWPDDSVIINIHLLLEADTEPFGQSDSTHNHSLPPFRLKKATGCSKDSLSSWETETSRCVTRGVQQILWSIIHT